MTELLKLSTIVERQFVTIVTKKHPKGKAYDLVNLDDLGPFEHQTIVTLHGKAAELLQTTSALTEPQANTLRKALGDIVKLLMPSIEPAVLASLSDAKRSQIVQVWAARNTAAEAEAGNARSRRTTGGSSRNSKGSTAASRKRGSTSRRG